MRDYGKISTSIWNSRKFARLNTDARLLYLYLHTCPHVNSVGCFVLKEGYATADLGWPVEAYRKGIESLLQAHLIGFDSAESLVRLVNFFAFDPFTNGNHAKGAIKIALALPDCPEKINLLKEIAEVPHATNLPEIREAIERLSKGYRTPEPEPEPEPEPYNPRPPSVVSPPTESATEKADDPKKPKPPRGTTLPTDWTLTPEYELAGATLGLTKQEIHDEADRFRDFWIAKSGRDATKRDWLATWRNWCRTHIERRSSANHANRFSQSERIAQAVRRAGLEGPGSY